MTLLHLDTSILGDKSVSRIVSRAIVERLIADRPGTEVVHRDLAADPIAHLSGRYLAGQGSDAAEDPALRTELALGSRVLDEFLAARIVVIGVGFYNFGIPSQLKAWIDRIAVAGRTFRYTETGSEGLAGGKRVILAVARGGFYGPESPAAAREHAESYLRVFFAFLGIEEVEVISAEGIAIGPEHRERAITQAHARIAALAA